LLIILLAFAALYVRGAGSQRAEPFDKKKLKKSFKEKVIALAFAAHRCV
jgi:hypothetical protein